jgi:hypothetical protein
MGFCLHMGFLPVIVFLVINQLSFIATSIPLVHQTDYSMGSCKLLFYIDQVSFSYVSQIGSKNQTVIATHAPPVFPISINYRLISSLGYGADYSIISNTISLSVEVQKIDATSVSISFYTDYA